MNKQQQQQANNQPVFRFNKVNTAAAAAAAGGTTTTPPKNDDMAAKRKLDQQSQQASSNEPVNAFTNGANVKKARQQNDDTTNGSGAENNACKTHLQMLNDLIVYHKLKVKFDVIDEKGPQHAKIFTLKCTICDPKQNELELETYTASGSSIIKAKQAIAEQALTSTKIEKPTPDQMKRKRAAIQEAEQQQMLLMQQQQQHSPSRNSMSQLMSTNFDSLMTTSANLMELKYDKYEFENKHFNKRHLLAKHHQVQPKREHLEMIEFVLKQIEINLKAISDKLMNECIAAAAAAAEVEAAATKAQEAVAAKTEENGATAEAKSEQATNGDATQAAAAAAATATTASNTTAAATAAENNEKHRHLKGCFRVGNYEKSTLIKSDRLVELIILTSKIPNYKLVKRILDELEAGDLFKATPEASTNGASAAATSAATPTPATTPAAPKIKFDLAKNLTLCRNEDELRANGCVYLVYKLVETSTSANGDETSTTTTVEDEYKFKLTFSSLDYAKEEGGDEPGDYRFSSERCGESIRQIRQLEWFNRNLKPIANAMLIIRIMRDVCARSPTWAALNDSLMEFIIDKCFARHRYEDLTLKFRTLFELIASGLLFLNELQISTKSQATSQSLDDADSALLTFLDPINMEPTQTPATTAANGNEPAAAETAAAAAAAPNSSSTPGTYLFSKLTAQQKEDLTFSAQHALRLLTLNKCYEILGIDLIEQQQPPQNQQQKGNSQTVAKASADDEAMQEDDQPMMSQEDTFKHAGNGSAVAATNPMVDATTAAAAPATVNFTDD